MAYHSISHILLQYSFAHFQQSIHVLRGIVGLEGLHSLPVRGLIYLDVDFSSRKLVDDKILESLSIMNKIRDGVARYERNI